MDKESRLKAHSGVDKGLVAMFLKMSPEERLRTNDNAVRAILELRHAYKQQKNHVRRSHLSAIPEERLKGSHRSAAFACPRRNIAAVKNR